jgi:hypothetical protein
VHTGLFAEISSEGSGLRARSTGGKNSRIKVDPFVKTIFRPQ